MDRWQDDLIGAVSGDSASEREVFECIQRASRALGFQHVSYGFQAPLPTDPWPALCPRQTRGFPAAILGAKAPCPDIGLANLRQGATDGHSG